MTPYETQPAKAFWRTAVAAPKGAVTDALWTPRFEIGKTDRFATYGSCFAQHFSAALAAQGYDWISAEPGPAGLLAAHAKLFNYGVYSARTGNIYTTSMLAQWCRWAIGGAAMPDEIIHEDGRFFDPFRPVVEPYGFASEDEIHQTRAVTLAAFRDSIARASVFVFTLGLSESWINRAGGWEYPICPGTACGEFDANAHAFRNQTYPEVLEQLEIALDLMKSLNPALRLLLTVSPVPLTATATQQHVLVATTYSKSTLRAVAGDMAANRADVDYFPSYELITSPVFGGQFFAENRRSVTDKGVSFVMDCFFKSRTPADTPADTPPATEQAPQAGQAAGDLVCEEELLDAFGGDE